MNQAVGEISVELKAILAVEDKQRIFGDRIINTIFNKIEKEDQNLAEKKKEFNKFAVFSNY